MLLAYVYFYDLRGGGVEAINREDKRGLGLTKRNKKRFEAQQMLVQLGTLAHNVIVWTCQWLAPHCPKVTGLGILRIVRDTFHVGGLLVTYRTDYIFQVGLNQINPLASGLAAGLQVLLAPEQVAISWGEI